jgi:hypothetical protein
VLSGVFVWKLAFSLLVRVLDKHIVTLAGEMSFLYDVSNYQGQSYILDSVEVRSVVYYYTSIQWG